MDPLTTFLLTAIAAAAAGAIAGGVGDAAGGDAWAAAKIKLAGWMRLDDKRQREAFERAVRQASDTLQRDWRDPGQMEATLQVLQIESPEAKQFVQAAIEELLLSETPNLGRLLDLYRRGLRFSAALRRQQLPDWEQIRPALVAFLTQALPEAIRKESTLRPIVLEQAQLQLLDEVRAQRAAAQDQTAILLRVEAMLREMLLQPQIQATITAGNGSTISNAPIHVLLGNYRALPDTPPDMAALYARYREYVRGEYEILDFRGILQVQNRLKLPLEAIYVPLRGPFRSSSPGVEQIRTDLKPGRILVGYRESNETTLHTLIRETPRLVILGDPGSGKSTLVKYVMLSLLRGQAFARIGLEESWLPILFPVAAFAEARQQQPDLAPLDYLSDFYCGKSQPDFGELFTRALLSGRALLLFDGLDEVRDRDDRFEIVRCLESFVRTWDLPGNRFLATSRIAGYPEAPLDSILFMQTEVQPFNPDDIRLFAHHWSAAYERVGWDEAVSAAELERKTREHERDLIAAIFANEKAAELAQNPLLLTMLALIRIGGVSLPNRRVELYELIIKALAETWNRARSLSGRPIDVYLKNNRQKLDEGFVVNLLGPTALWIHSEKPGGLVDQSELERQLAKTFREIYNVSKGDAGDLARDFLELVETQTGLLQARGKRLYGFLHLTLEEYLAARALLDQRAEMPNVLQAYATQAGWREVVRLCVASIREPRGVQRALDELLKTPTVSDKRGIPAVRAGECLLDLGGAIYQAGRLVIDALLITIADLQVPIGTRVEAGHILGRLGDPRLLDVKTGEALGYGDYEGMPRYWCHVDKGPFWFGDERVQDKQGKTQRNEDGTLQFVPSKLKQIELPYTFKIARYPVTNAEYALFLAANGPAGYDPDKSWWTEEGKKFLAPGGHRWDNQDEYVRWPRYWDDARYNSPAQPVVGISWYEAAAYCRWLTDLWQQWLPADQEIRLPTSLEWERAARHNDQRPFPWGETTPTPEHANYAATGIGAPSPVGCFPAGQAMCGAEDLLGNTLEWLSTPYKRDRDRELQPQKEFTPNEIALLSPSWFGIDLDQMYCGVRLGFDPRNRGINWSFRVVQSLRAHE
ncbi:SUMF1/EgtB/PvdO family nonheme iron enzyme [Oscillochloris sp. ZM17-4]|uniref:NACHT domain-containing protein n=1 Tax=Oscillochloris sp. ZM17-4 TaxID=2866714 RepID=UPI001C72A792|nr:SUMF1/EgtB/PvdO family nonheme iron enzyme [Oscillochloris sp. ZM17-4]MBX0330067.1 SUMF1/EgtB/PvdO family nonheme iron enzyme [Oscillochloris sp. ZM17-4]